jgi:geranylgeranyl pyrophosphate synthase
MDTAFESRLLAMVTGGGVIAGAERHLLDAPKAKRVRPKFVLACGRLLGVAEKELLAAACAVELIHTGTLLHDDIIDEADERRARPSVNALYGNTMALLAGDRLLSRGLLAAATARNGARAARQAADTLMELTEAVAIEAQLKPKEATPADVIKIADGKTGALFGLCGYFAGLAAKDVRAARRLHQAGRLAGRAFQIRDDMDDLAEDIANGVPTLPQMVSREQAEQAITEALREAVAQVEPYADRPGYQELVENIYALARTPMPAVVS